MNSPTATTVLLPGLLTPVSEVANGTVIAASDAPPVKPQAVVTMDANTPANVFNLPPHSSTIVKVPMKQ